MKGNSGKLANVLEGNLALMVPWALALAPACTCSVPLSGVASASSALPLGPVFTLQQVHA